MFLAQERGDGTSKGLCSVAEGELWIVLSRNFDVDNTNYNKNKTAFVVVVFNYISFLISTSSIFIEEVAMPMSSDICSHVGASIINTKSDSK